MQGWGMSSEATPDHRTWSRRRFLKVGLGGTAVAIVAGVTGVELVSHGVLPGRQTLDELDGACSVPSVPLAFSPSGSSLSGTFSSRARHRSVGYTLAYPPGHGPGSSLPLIVMLHGFGASHTTALSEMSPAQAMALQVDGRPLAPMAMVTVDGGGGYWNPHPGDDPMAMVVDELIPMCQGLNLGRPPQKIGTMGISTGATAPSSWPKSTQIWSPRSPQSVPPSGRAIPRLTAPIPAPTPHLRHSRQATSSPTPIRLLANRYEWPLAATIHFTLAFRP